LLLFFFKINAAVGIKTSTRAQYNDNQTYEDMNRATSQNTIYVKYTCNNK